MKVYPDPTRDARRQSRSAKLNAAMLAVVRRAFEMLDAEGLSFEGLPASFQNLDALEMLDALALAAHEAIEHHASALPPESQAGLQGAVDMLWHASAVAAKMREFAAASAQPTFNDLAEVALLAATVGDATRTPAGAAVVDPGKRAQRQRQIEAARKARRARARATWESKLLDNCRERLAETPTLGTRDLAITVCARNGIQSGHRPHVEALVEHWRRNGTLQPPSVYAR
jgi:hypothetical protein